MGRILARLTYANVMATVAVFIALGGASYAALKLPRNSVGPKQLKAGAVTLAKLNRASRTSLTGPAGPQGPTGPIGAPGPSTGYAASHEGAIVPTTTFSRVLSLDLPAGSYLIQAKLDGINISEKKTW